MTIRKHVLLILLVFLLVKTHTQFLLSRRGSLIAITLLWEHEVAVSPLQYLPVLNTLLAIVETL